MTSPNQPAFVAWPALLAGVMATLVGIGLARFAYTPLIPVLVQANWFSATDAVYLGAANLLGYLIGALLAHRLTRWASARVVVGASLAAVVLSFVLCASPSTFYWFFSWRLMAGVAGAVLMVVVPSMLFSATPQDKRPMVGTLVFSGIGLGALLAATVIPLILSHGLSATWWLLGALSLLAGCLCDVGLRRLSVRTDARPPTARSGEPGLQSIAWLVVVLVVVAYALDGVGFIAHTVFWVDFLARENALGQPAASLQWALFGAGAALGPFLMGLLVRQVGWHRALWMAFLMKAGAVALPLMSMAWLSQTVSSLVVGALTPGIVAIVSGRLAELVGPHTHQKVWGRATAAFALAQAVGGYSMAAIFAWTGSASAIFAIGSTVLLVSAVLVWVSRVIEVSRSSDGRD